MKIQIFLLFSYASFSILQSWKIEKNDKAVIHNTKIMFSLDDIIDNVHQIAPIVSNNENATVIHFLIQFAIL